MKRVIKSMIISWLMASACFESFGAASDKSTELTDWNEAMAKWSAFASEHMERMKAHDLTLPLSKLPDYKFDMEWVELKSRLITKYLPDYRIFTDRRFEFVLDRAGHIICLGDTWPLGRPFVAAPDFEVMKLNKFIHHLKITLTDEKTAIELAQLKEIVKGNSHLNDQELDLREQSWRYKASKRNSAWFVTMEYIGPPASIIMPPVWKIETDRDGYMQTIKELSLDYDLSGDGDIDLSDVKKLEDLLGQCRSDAQYSPMADVDADGCITDKDRDLLNELSTT